MPLSPRKTMRFRNYACKHSGFILGAISLNSMNSFEDAQHDLLKLEFDPVPDGDPPLLSML
jgi:hypothetical protein